MRLQAGVARSTSLRCITPRGILGHRTQLIKTRKEWSPARGAMPDSAESRGASTDLGVIASRLKQLSLPYWTSPEVGATARWKLAGVVLLTLSTTAVSVAFNYLGRDFFNALSEKNEPEFQVQLVSYHICELL
jgi:hypothetical protein